MTLKAYKRNTLSDKHQVSAPETAVTKVVKKVAKIIRKKK